MSANPRPPLGSWRPSFGAELRIDCPTGKPLATRVWLNRQEITNCLQAVTVTLAEGDVVNAELTIRVDGIEITAQTLAALKAVVRANAAPEAEAEPPSSNDGWGREAPDDDE